MFDHQLLLNPRGQYFIRLWNVGWMMDMWSTPKYSTAKCGPAIMWLWNIIQPEIIRKKNPLSLTYSQRYESLIFEGTGEILENCWLHEMQMRIPCGGIVLSFWYFLLLSVCFRPHHLFLLQMLPKPKVPTSEIGGTCLLLTHMWSLREGKCMEGMRGWAEGSFGLCS